MKKQYLFIVYLFFFCCQQNLKAQQTTMPLVPKVYNYSTFSKSQVLINGELEKNSNSYSKMHPEYGILPFNAGCDDCSEIIDQRTINTRYYVGNDPKERAVYAQTSLNDLHYKNEQGDWITIDYRLHPTKNENIYSADNQEQPTSINLNDYYTFIQLTASTKLVFNGKWALSGSKKPEITKLMHPTSHSVGEDGAVLFNAWDGIDIRHTFTKGSIKTDFVVNNLSAIDPTSAYSIFKETIQLPDGFSIIRDIYEGEESINGRWVGDLILVDAFGNEYARFDHVFTYMENPVDEEMAALNLVGEYAIEQVGNLVTLSLYIDNNWLNDPARTFPIVIDPTVSGTLASIAGTPLGSRYWPAYCVHTMMVSTPANATLTTANVALDVDAKIAGCTPSGNCARNFTQVYISTSCGVDPIGAPGIIYTCVGGGTCLLPGHLVLPTTSMPHLVVDCFTPSCASYTIPFNVHLQRLACSNTDPLCDVPCVQLDLFEVTIKGKTVEATATAAGGTSYTILDCTDQSDWLAPDEDVYGVPAYTYSWSPIGATDDSIYVTFPLGTTSYTLTITDACGNIATDVVTVTNNCILLPLPLTEFSGYHQNDFNLLNWSTQSEIGTNYIIERSVTGNDFIPIGTIDSKPNGGFQTYSFSDLSPDNQIVYYRLKQINTKNEVLFSEIIAIKTAYKPGNEIISTIFDAENNMLQLSINSEKEITAKMLIYDLAGKIVFSNSIALGTGTTVVKSTLPELAKGAYVVRILVEDVNLESKFVN